MTAGSCPQALGSIHCRRISRYVLVHAPHWFENTFSLLARALPAGARNQCVLCRNVEELEEHIERAVIPKEWGGECERDLGDSDEERKLKAHVAARTAAAGSQGM